MRQIAKEIISTPATRTTKPRAATTRCDHADMLQSLIAQQRSTDQTVARLTDELLTIRRERLPASSEILTELCAAIYGVKGRNPFSSGELFEWATTGVDERTARLAQAVRRATGPDPEVQPLARLLSRACGLCGPWHLTLYRARSNRGKLYRIEKKVTK